MRPSVPLTRPNQAASPEGLQAMMKTKSLLLGSLAAAAAMLCSPATAQQPRKPNIVIIWGDDIGQSNISAYSRGMMGYRTPNIDSVAKGGMMFTDYYAEK